MNYRRDLELRTKEGFQLPGLFILENIKYNLDFGVPYATIPEKEFYIPKKNNSIWLPNAIRESLNLKDGDNITLFYFNEILEIWYRRDFEELTDRLPKNYFSKLNINI